MREMVVGDIFHDEYIADMLLRRLARLLRITFEQITGNWVSPDFSLSRTYFAGGRFEIGQPVSMLPQRGGEMVLPINHPLLRTRSPDRLTNRTTVRPEPGEQCLLSRTRG